MNIANLDIVVVGGATGGCAASLFLARAGARVKLIERVAEPRSIGAGIALAPNGIAVLEALGLHAIVAVAKAQEGVRITDAAGRTLLAPPQPALRIAMLKRATLQGILLDAVSLERGIETHFGCELLDATRDGQAVVRRLATGTEETFQADLIIGADGLHSRVRSCGTFDATVRPTGIQYVRTLVAEGLGQGVEAWTSAGVFGSFEVDGGTYAFASCGTPPCRAALATRDLSTLRSAWAEAYPASEPILRAVSAWDQLIVNEVVRVECSRWVDGRMMLLGDAAHAMAPNLGQGANSALVDACVLLDELRVAPDLDTALVQYERRRKPAVARVADTSAMLGRLAEVTHPAGRWARDRILAPVLNAMSSERSMKIVLQEEPERLLEIGRSMS